MLSINTNLSSLIAQNSLKNSTNILNQAVERMTTGYKINHAKDNAANYSISTNMTTKINSYMVAEDNVAMGLDMLNTAGENLNLITDKLTRLRALSTQCSNGTYGEQSKNAINAEANALIDEISRLYYTAEYNGKKLFTSTETSNQGELTPATMSLARSGGTATTNNTIAVNSDGFIKTVAKRDTSKMTKLESVDEAVPISSGTYSIGSAEELIKLAEMTNADLITGGEFVLSADIDMSGIDWVPIGDVGARYDDNGDLIETISHVFTGTIDGNGHTISNLECNREGYVAGFIGKANNITIKNLSLKNVDIFADQDYTGCSVESAAGLIVYGTGDIDINNCNITGHIIANYSHAGGFISSLSSGTLNIENSYANCSVNGEGNAAGFVALLTTSTININDSFATGHIYSNMESAGGLIGEATSITSAKIKDCSFSGAITSCWLAAGLIGSFSGDELYINNSYTSGNMYGYLSAGLVYSISCTLGAILNSYSNARVDSGECDAAGFVHYINANNKFSIENCYSAGDVYGGPCSGTTAGFISQARNTTVKNSYSTSSIFCDNTENSAAGFIGDIYNSEVINCYSTGNVVAGNCDCCTPNSSGFAITINNSIIENCYTTGTVIGAEDYRDVWGDEDAGEYDEYLYSVSAFACSVNNSTISNCYTLGEIENGDAIFAINSDANSTFNNCYYSDTYDTTALPLISGNAVSNNINATNIKTPFVLGAVLTPVSLQIGISSNESSHLSVDLGFEILTLSQLRGIGNSTADYSAQIDKILNEINEKQVHLGAAENRLESALDEISTQYENLVSSRSTIRDADIADESSRYIQQQILQQAAATLLATANQSPSIALQLI